MEKRSRRLAQADVYPRVMTRHALCHLFQQLLMNAYQRPRALKAASSKLLSSTNISTGLQPTVMPPSSKDVVTDVHSLHA